MSREMDGVARVRKMRGATYRGRVMSRGGDEAPLR